MKILGHRFCYVGENALALDLSKTLAALGWNIGRVFTEQMLETETLSDDNFSGAIFNVDDDSWVEIWSELPGVPKGIMLQIIVDNADAFAENAKKNGLEPQGPVESHGERIYYLMPASGLPISFQSKIDSMSEN